jgi:hypothetical protein
LWSRLGTGYVYSDKFVSDKDALKEFKSHLKNREKISNVEELEYRNIKSRVGIHKRLWVKNVVAIGLSSGFIEPLEGNGLFSVHEFLIRLIRNLQREKISQWDRDNFNYQCKHLFKTFAEFVGLHYALSHRNDTEYWKHCFNKSWEEALINLKPKDYQGFKDAVQRRTYDNRFEDYGGLQSIAAGMHWSPTDKSTLIVKGKYEEKKLEKEFSTCINKLNERKEICKTLVKTKTNFFTALKNVHK